MARFEDVVVSFWGDGDYGVQEPLTASAITTAGQQLGVVLSPELLELLRIRNGGPVADTWATFPTNEPASWSVDHVPFDQLFGVGREGRGVTLLDSPYLVEEWGLPSYVSGPSSRASRPDRSKPTDWSLSVPRAMISPCWC